MQKPEEFRVVHTWLAKKFLVLHKSVSFADKFTKVCKHLAKKMKTQCAKYEMPCNNHKL